MPSFLNKVFGYKKQDDKDVPRQTTDGTEPVTLLDGKYEAIPPMLSPAEATFAEAQQATADRDTGFSLFKYKARGFPRTSAQKSTVAVPHLTLRLPGPKENSDARALGTVFDADPVAQLLDDAVIAARRLSPLEALSLLRACAQAITERGLETLGIMHPHWFSASPDVQRKLISLFIRSLTPSLSSTPSAATSAFENELHYARSPHDVAAVLRWGLRHLTLEYTQFGKDSAWYQSFFDSERLGSYPPNAYSELLLPQLPAHHVELLTVTLDLIASLAAHAETNGISGSKLSKFWGVWLLLATRAEESDDWNRFYARWERAGRILEHLFLARLREESFALRLPTRLQELVQHYPYHRGLASTDQGLLPRPRFSTRQYDALCVRVESVLTHDARQPKQHPVQLLCEAFRLGIENPFGDEHIAQWQALKNIVFEDVSSSNPQFMRIFVDETIQLLSSIPAGNNAPSPTLLASPMSKFVSRKRSSSISKVLERALSKSTAGNGSTPVSPTSPTSPIITDWAQFSLSGFGDTPSTQPLAVLYSDEDMEITQPRVSYKSERRAKSRSRRRRSEDHEPSDTLSSQPDHEASVLESRVASVHLVQIDEAFIDFWSDAVVDPISANWPTFVLCGIKESRAEVRWLLIEQAYTRQASPRGASPDGRRGRSPRPSFRSDISSFRINSVFSSARKRFSVFSKSTSDLDPRKGKAPVAGELGEVLVEEETPNWRVATATTAVAADRKTSEMTTDLAKRVHAEVPSTEPARAGLCSDVQPVGTVNIAAGRISQDVARPADDTSNGVVATLVVGASSGGITQVDASDLTTSAAEAVQGAVATEVPAQLKGIAETEIRTPAQEDKGAQDVPVPEHPADESHVAAPEPRVEVMVETPVVETARWVEETPGPETATEEHAPQLPLVEEQSVDEIAEKPQVPIADVVAPQGQVDVEDTPSTQVLDVPEHDAAGTATPGLAEQVTLAPADNAPSQEHVEDTLPEPESGAHASEVTVVDDAASQTQDQVVEESVARRAKDQADLVEDAPLEAEPAPQILDEPSVFKEVVLAAADNAASPAQVDTPLEEEPGVQPLDESEITLVAAPHAEVQAGVVEDTPLEVAAQVLDESDIPEVSLAAADSAAPHVEDVEDTIATPLDEPDVPEATLAAADNAAPQAQDHMVENTTLEVEPSTQILDDPSVSEQVTSAAAHDIAAPCAEDPAAPREEALAAPAPQILDQPGLLPLPAARDITADHPEAPRVAEEEDAPEMNDEEGVVEEASGDPCQDVGREARVDVPVEEPETVAAESGINVPVDSSAAEDILDEPVPTPETDERHQQSVTAQVDFTQEPFEEEP